MRSAGLDWTLFFMAAPFLAAALAPLVHRALGGLAGWVLAGFPAAMFLHFASFLPMVAGGGAGRGGFSWAAQAGVEFSYLVDGLSLLFALLITGIGAFIIIYSGAYLKGHPHQGRFLAFMLLFMGAMLGLVLADDFITLFIFWELTSISSFLLIGFEHYREASRRAAIQALVVTGAGGLSLLAGFLLIRVLTGATSMSEAFALGPAMTEHALYPVVLVLVLGGAFTKSAQFPFHFWLANAMEAPTPVSAYLHSATMVKGGVYLLMRMAPILGGTELWTVLLPVFGGATLILGTVLALRQTDLKLVLAYTTVASLGLLVMLTGTGIDYAILGAASYLLAHSLFKGALFMAVGGIDHEAGSRDVRRLSGLRAEMPVTFGAALLAACSMGGLPLTIGFFGKETMYAGLLEGGPPALAALAAAVFGNALMFAAGFTVALRPFLGSRLAPADHVHDGPFGLWLGPVVLAALGVIAVLFGGWTSANLVGPTVTAIAGSLPTSAVSAAIHLNWALLLSALTIMIGILVFLALPELRAGLNWRLARAWGPDRGFDHLVSGLTRFSGAATGAIQTGNLETYIAVTFATTAAALLLPMALFGEWPEGINAESLNFQEWAIVFLALAGLGVVLANRNRLIAIVSLGIQGFAVALLFMLFGAPDLSFTQFMVETLSVVILALAMTRLSLTPSDHRSLLEIAKDSTIALACGVGFAALLLSVTARPFDARLSEFFAEHSREVAHGRNIVNVIIVDFRGLDTLGEIAVVMTAGFAILALLRVRAAWRRADGEAHR